MRSGGFTLAELLTVIVIITVLVVIGWGVTQPLRESAGRVQCIGNLKQVTTALLAWTADNNGVFPYCVEDDTAHPGWGKNYWSGRLFSEGYITDHHLFFCPEQSDRYYLEPERAQRWKDPDASEWAFTSFGINQMGIAPRNKDQANRIPARLQLIENSSRIILLAESQAANQPRDGWYCFIGNHVMNGGGWDIKGRHDGRATVSFVDGHIESIPVSELRTMAPTVKDPPWVEGVYTRH